MDLTKILDLIKDPDLKIKINDLYSENLKLKEDNFRLKKEIGDFRKNEETSRKLRFENNHYFIGSVGPYCTKCWDSDYKLIRIHKGSLFNGLQSYSCPNCKTRTETGVYQSEDFFER